jgi:hypothetical protein
MPGRLFSALAVLIGQSLPFYSISVIVIFWSIFMLGSTPLKPKIDAATSVLYS